MPKRQREHLLREKTINRGAKRVKIYLKDLNPPIAYLHAKKAQEINPELNADIDLEKLTSGTHTKLTFQCPDHPNCPSHQRSTQPSKYRGCLPCLYPGRKRVGTLRIEQCECVTDDEIKKPIDYLKNVRSDLWQELHSTLNSNVEEIRFSNATKLVWICKTHDKFSVNGCCHEPYRATIHDRIKGINCGICRKRQGLQVNAIKIEDCCKCPITEFEGINLLQFTNPDLWKELMAAKTLNLLDDPDFESKSIYLSAASPARLWWKCLVHTTCEEHIRDSSVLNRVGNGTGCPACAAASNRGFGSREHLEKCSCEKKNKIERDGVTLKLCLECLEHLPESDFTDSIKGIDGLNAYCRKCTYDIGRGITHKINVLTRVMVQLCCSCIDCNLSDRAVMEFDHKLQTISRRMRLSAKKILPIASKSASKKRRKAYSNEAPTEKNKCCLLMEDATS